jgi:hypothetical protein
LKRFFKELVTDIWQVSWTLFKIMIPAIIVIKILEELGVVDLIGELLGPIMAAIGLPESMGLIWATAILINIYTALIIFVQTPEAMQLTVAQVSVLSLLILIAHNLPVEARIAQRAGVRLWFTLLLRLGGGLFFAFLLHQIYSRTGWQQERITILWQAPALPETLLEWAWLQVEGLFAVFLIIVVLLFLLKVFRLIGVEALMVWCLRPFLKLLGIGEKAISLTLVGMTLGIALGGGLLIKEVDQGNIPPKDIFASMCLLSLLHSIIEDTLLMLLIGADIWAILWFRIICGLFFIALIMRQFFKFSDSIWNRYLLNKYCRV